LSISLNLLPICTCIDLLRRSRRRLRLRLKDEGSV
jgi:hypothetical protein